VKVAVDDQDRVYIATHGGRCQILVLDENYEVVRRIGRRGRERGAFYAVTGLSVDKQGRVLVTDAQSVPVQVFSPEGELLLAFGAHEVGWGNFSLPSGIVRDGDGNLWVADPIRQVVKRFDESGRFLGFIGGLGTAPGDMYYPVALAGDGGQFIIVLEKNGARFQVFRVTS
jgi:sugar lactone lactonase YvrE